jgi:hypothetical protein
MKQTIGLYEFRRAFEQTRPDNFSYEGQGILFDYLEELDYEMELDVIGLCCDYTEDNAVDIAVQYDIDVEGLDENEVFDTVLEYLSENTSVAGSTVDGRIVYANF